MKTLITNGLLLTMNDSFDVFDKGFILFDEGRIEQLGQMADCPDAAASWQVLDADGDIIMPGFINTHCHLGMIPFRSLADDVPDRLRKYLFPLEQHMTAALAAQSARYAVCELLLAGTTTVCDMYYFEDEIAAVCDEMGIRAFLGETIIDMPTCDAKDADEALVYTDAFIQKWQAHKRITPVIAPHATNTVKKDTLLKIKQLSQRSNTPVTMHVSEMDYEMAYFSETYGQTPIAFLDDIGLLEQPFILAHGIFIQESDISLLQKRQVGVAHCIGANTKSAKGVAPIPQLLAGGVAVGLGTDGPSSGNTLDHFTQMKLFANFHKTRWQDRALFPARDIVRLATIGSAEVLGMAAVTGSLEAGKKADVIQIDTKSAAMFPMFDPYSVLVYSAGPHDVRNTWVDGRQLVRDKQLIKADLFSIRKKLDGEMTEFKLAVERINNA